MIESSPRRGLGIVDSILAFLVWIMFPFIRRDIEKHCFWDAHKKVAE